MNDTYECELLMDSMSDQEKHLVTYLRGQSLEFLTEPQNKQFAYEAIKKTKVRSLVETDDSDVNSPHCLNRTLSLNLKMSPLKQKRLSLHKP